MGLDAEVLFMFIRINHHACILLMFVGLSLSTSCNNQNLDTSRLDNLENNTIATINQQLGAITSSLSDLKEMSKTIEECVNSLSDESEDMKALIVALQSATYSLQEQIKELEAYVDSELSSTRNWANATFATLEQYASIQTEISAIKTLLNESMADLTAQYKVAIETAISDSETSMKSWVNTQLAQGYYNIAAIDGKVSALESLISEGDSKLQVQINEQKEELKQAKTDLTNEYKQYINQAIAAGGIINQAIAAQVKAAQDNLQAQIDVINSRLDALEDRLGKLEEDFVNRIQSLKYIPEYSDGTVKISDVLKMNITLDFLISPASMAETIREAWKADGNVISAYLRYTKSPETRAVSPAIPLNVTSVSINETGVLQINIEESETHPVGNGEWHKEFESVLYLQISDGNNDIVSDFITAQTYYDDLSRMDKAIITDEFVELSPIKEGEYRTANSYIISKSGLYSFKAYKGNSQELAGSLTTENHPMGKIESTEILWETFGTATKPVEGELIKSVGYHAESIYFRTSNEFHEGNAVIAVKDANGKILWSWHIWLTDKPLEQVYYNNAGIMMDRNLGAISATPGDVGALGLLYQWGRKDPFLGSSSVSSKTTAKSTNVWPSDVGSGVTTGTIMYSISNPTTYISRNDKNDDWYYTGNSFTDNSRWSTLDKPKSIYDPCPAGWRIPDGGEDSIWAKALVFSTGVDGSFDTAKFGMNLTSILGDDSSIWYPFTGTSTYVGCSYGPGEYWTSSPSGFDACAYALRFNIFSSINKVELDWQYGMGYRASCYAVRCQKDM